MNIMLYYLLLLEVCLNSNVMGYRLLHLSVFINSAIKMLLFVIVLSVVLFPFTRIVELFKFNNSSIIMKIKDFDNQIYWKGYNSFMIILLFNSKMMHPHFLNGQRKNLSNRDYCYITKVKQKP